MFSKRAEFSLLWASSLYVQQTNRRKYLCHIWNFPQNNWLCVPTTTTKNNLKEANIEVPKVQFLIKYLIVTQMAYLVSVINSNDLTFSWMNPKQKKHGSPLSSSLNDWQQFAALSQHANPFLLYDVHSTYALFVNTQPRLAFMPFSASSSSRWRHNASQDTDWFNALAV